MKTYALEYVCEGTYWRDIIEKPDGSGNWVKATDAFDLLNEVERLRELLDFFAPGRFVKGRTS